jgi:SAM-dependent methyltransferase
MMNYAEIFDRRGHEYHQAMRLAPEARRCEFEALFAGRALRAGELIFDIPSGGGYLADYLAAPARIHGFEFSRGFAAENSQVALLDLEKPWEIGQADRVVSLAGLHHNDDPIGVAAKLATHVRSSGWLHVADVARGSRVGEWLNGFVHRHNELGHDGIFLPERRSAYPRAWDVVRLEVVACPWRFDSEATMARFCRLMFGVTGASDAEITRALREIVGVRTHAQGVELAWELLYLDVRCA